MDFEVEDSTSREGLHIIHFQGIVDQGPSPISCWSIVDEQLIVGIYEGAVFK